MILFIQPFGLSSPGGGSRILRALLKDSPKQWVSVSVGLAKPGTPVFGREIHIKPRPALGRLEHSRFHRLCCIFELPCLPILTSRVLAVARAEGVTAIHVIPHAGYECIVASRVSEELGIPLHVSVHDDFDYAIAGNPWFWYYRRFFKRIWRNAKSRTVISREMGEVMVSRFGEREYDIITDGLERVASGISYSSSGDFIVYFAGLFHLAYEDNFRILQLALVEMKKCNPHLNVRLMLRCGAVRWDLVNPALDVEILPFADESVVEREMASATILYLPLGFGEKQRLMNLYSLSTKMVSYLGAGVPILYHGPSYSAASKMLLREDAALQCNKLSVEVLIAALSCAGELRCRNLVFNSLKLAANKFSIRNIREVFWLRF